MMYTSAGAGYQVDGTDRFVLCGSLEKLALFTPQELDFLFFVLWCYATGRMMS
ncbi:MAG: hypothetical protein Q8O40_06625 [Chloroflexota bacterium]|nr:hypothetical protein [Chloroflexota bacterium]